MAPALSEVGSCTFWQYGHQAAESLHQHQHIVRRFDMTPLCERQSKPQQGCSYAKLLSGAHESTDETIIACVQENPVMLGAGSMPPQGELGLFLSKQPKKGPRVSGAILQIRLLPPAKICRPQSTLALSTTMPLTC